MAYTVKKISNFNAKINHTVGVDNLNSVSDFSNCFSKIMYCSVIVCFFLKYKELIKIVKDTLDKYNYLFYNNITFYL